MNCTQLLNESIEFYSHNPRGLTSDKTDCVYWNKHSNNKCAIGRCMNNVSVDKYATLQEDVEGLHSMLSSSNIDFDSILEPKYRGIPLDFWSPLQQLHDRNEYWCQTGLTREGREFVSKLRTLIKRHNWDG
jgi:hypothetical protein